MTEIAGRVALVTGGGSGIGKALAKALAAADASVVVADIISDNAQAVAAEITALGGRSIAVACDVCERDSIRQMKARANAVFGPVTLLVANAGATSFERLTDMSDANVDWIIQVNLMGVTYTIQAILPDMIAASRAGMFDDSLHGRNAAGLGPNARALFGSEDGNHWPDAEPWYRAGGAPYRRYHLLSRRRRDWDEGQ